MELIVFIGAGTGSEASSPVSRPVDYPHINETPKSSAPSTPENKNTQDYFARPARLVNPSTRSLPSTPQGSVRISFSPRIQFHDAWSASDYDRRGEIATCNRLTPMLAQQIKEELNSFKMVSRTCWQLGRRWLTCSAGDGGPRALQASHPLLLMIMHPFGHGVLAKTHFCTQVWCKQHV
jgi:hypothetical protein